jgi:hypothetical protein
MQVLSRELDALNPSKFAVDGVGHDTRPIGRLRQIILRRVDRRRTIPAFLAKEWCQAA